MKRIAFEPHIFQDICQRIRQLEKVLIECRTAKCTPIIQNLKSLIEHKEIIDIEEKEVRRGSQTIKGS